MEFEEIGDCYCLREKSIVSFFLGQKNSNNLEMEWLWGDISCFGLSPDICALMQQMKRKNCWEIWSKGMMKSEELDYKMILNGIFNSLRGYCASFEACYSPEESPWQRKWKKGGQRIARSWGLHKDSDRNGMLGRITVFFCFCPYTRSTAVSLEPP